ncbi:hypothetical protein D3C72_2550510 [compost metagenome]
MPMENRNRMVKSVVFSTTIPWRPRYAVTTQAGMPLASRLPSSPMPGASTETLIGSSMQ